MCYLSINIKRREIWRVAYTASLKKWNNVSELLLDERVDSSSILPGGENISPARSQNLHFNVQTSWYGQPARHRSEGEESVKCYLGTYRVIQNDCRGFNNLWYTTHLRQQYMCFLFNRTTLPSFCYIPYRCSICAPFVVLQTSTR